MIDRSGWVFRSADPSPFFSPGFGGGFPSRSIYQPKMIVDPAHVLCTKLGHGIYQRVWLALLLASFVPPGVFLSTGHVLLGVSTCHQPKGSVRMCGNRPRTYLADYDAGLVIPSMPQLDLLFVVWVGAWSQPVQCATPGWHPATTATLLKRVLDIRHDLSLSPSAPTSRID
jgi:hypothetical protein